MSEHLKQPKMQNNDLHLGPTGKFPDGKIHDDDAGEIKLAVAHDRDFVHIRFGTPIEWLSLPPKEAKELAALLLTHAEALS